MLSRPHQHPRSAALLLLAVALAGCSRARDAQPAVDLLRGRPAVLAAAAGDPASLTDATTLPEATPEAGAGVVLETPLSAIAVDMGELKRVAALSVQASADAILFVEASHDGAQWAITARLAPVLPFPELRTRRVCLERAVEARWLRLRVTSTRPAVVTDLAAFASAPRAWPPLDASRPDSYLPLLPMLTGHRLATLSIALSGLLVAGAVWSVVARRSRESLRQRRARQGALVLLALASLATWPNGLNFRYRTVLHYWEFAHYYLGSKYFAELGYTHLYTCAALADEDEGLDVGRLPMRDLRDDTIGTTAKELQRAPECRVAFGEARWAAFRRDAAFFRAQLGPEWTAMRRDHGYNPTPAWTLIGGSLASRVPATREGVAGLALIDVALLVAIFAVIWVTFGVEAACLGAGFFGLNSLTAYNWTGGAFLRYDWLFWLVTGVAALRAGRDGLAGFALAWTTLLRIFPGVALAGLGLKIAGEVLTARSLEPLRTRWRLVAGAALAVVLGGLLPLATLGRAHAWQEFAANSAKHLENESANIVGLPVFLSHDPATSLEMTYDPLLLDPAAPWQTQRAARRHATAPARWAAIACFVLLLAAAVRRVPDWAAAALGVSLLPVLFSLACYYYSAFLVFAPLYVLAATPVVSLAAMTWATVTLSAVIRAPDETYVYQSLVLVVFAVVVTALFARWRPASSESAPTTRGAGRPVPVEGTTTPAGTAAETAETPP